MGIPFTQYMLPDGRKVPVSVERPAEIEGMAQQFIEMGGRFECEMLSTGQISLTAVCEIDGEEQDAEIEICANGPSVPDAVDRLVRSAFSHVVPA
jgi:hypothetical protein